MNVAGISPRTVVEIAREARGGGAARGAVVVDGPLASHLARELAAGGEPGVVRVGRDVTGASAVVCILGGAPRAEQMTLLRDAERAGLPLVAVQTGDAGQPVPYVLPDLVVDCEPGHGFPVDRIARALVQALGDGAAELAAGLPVLRPATARAIPVRAAVAAAGMAVVSRSRALLPLLVPLQARMLRSLSVARGDARPVTSQQVGTTVGAELGGALAAGLAARALVRRLPVAGRLVDAAVAAGVTYALAVARRRT